MSSCLVQKSSILTVVLLFCEVADGVPPSFLILIFMNALFLLVKFR